VDSVRVGEFFKTSCSLDFMSFDYEDINGLLGLDILLDAGFIIDMKNLTMYLQK
jgi:hypothetical protein